MEKFRVCGGTAVAKNEIDFGLKMNLNKTWK